MKNFEPYESEYVEARDELLKYLKQETERFFFDELSEDYLSSKDMEFMSGVPVPFLKKDIMDLAGGEGIEITVLSDNMAYICGINPNFKYAESYLRFLRTCFEDNLIHVLVSMGNLKVSEEKYKESVIYYRAAKFAEPYDIDSIFGYAVSCRLWFSELDAEENEELMWVLKGEAKDAFEHVYRLDPHFPAALYFLGYIYLNEGQYSKAMAFWKSFLKEANISEDESIKEAVPEIEERVESLKDPVKIEFGIDAAAAGRYGEALKILEPYVESEYSSWWPLHFNLAEIYRALGHIPEAIEGHLRVLDLSPSNRESILNLAELYAASGEKELAEKFLRKSEILSD